MAAVSASHCWLCWLVRKLMTQNGPVLTGHASVTQCRAIVLQQTGAVCLTLGHICPGGIVRRHQCHSSSLSSLSEPTDSSAPLMGICLPTCSVQGQRHQEIGGGGKGIEGERGRV